MTMEQQTELLPPPRVVRCFFARQVQPHLPVMELEWDPDSPGIAEETWLFPGRLTIQGPAPRTFGVVIQRHGPDSYSVRLVWNDLGMTWGHLRRVQILTSALAPVLQSLGTDLWTVLEQPIDGAGHTVWPVTGERMTG
jgi:hypothetical protein